MLQDMPHLATTLVAPTEALPPPLSALQKNTEIPFTSRVSRKTFQSIAQVIFCGSVLQLQPNADLLAQNLEIVSNSTFVLVPGVPECP